MDNELFERLQSLPVLPFHRAIRQDEKTLAKKREAFFSSSIIPSFSYPRAHEIDTRNFLRALQDYEYWLEKHDTHPVIKHLYRKKVKELRTRAWLMRAICRQDDQLITELSKDLFGPIRQSPESLAKEFNKMLSNADRFTPKEKVVDADQFMKLARKTLDHYGMTNWRLELTDAASISIGHGFRASDPVIRIPKTLHVSKARAARLLTHEIEVHALRTHNGYQSPIHLLARGLDRYVQTEEGLATYFQEKLSDKPRKHAPGFWDAWTISLTQIMGFEDVFETIAQAKAQLNRAIGYSRPRAKAEDSAWRLCVRTYRAISNPSQPGVGFWRDHIYRSGNQLIHEVAKKYPDSIEKLFVGNIGIQHLPDIAELELPQPKTPELISKDLVSKI